jgi:hypothetical protein
VLPRAKGRDGMEASLASALPQEFPGVNQASRTKVL